MYCVVLNCIVLYVLAFADVKVEVELDPQELVEVKVEPDVEVKYEDQKADADIEGNFEDQKADTYRDGSQDFSSHYAEAGIGNCSSEWPHKRSECGKSFPTFAGVQKHSYKHKPKIFSCDICGQNFYHPNLLKTHRWETLFM